MLVLQANPQAQLGCFNTQRQPLFSKRPQPKLQPQAQQGTITEIILQSEEINSVPMLMPLLAQLSDDQRWFAWIAPPMMLTKPLLLNAGIDLNKVIQLSPNTKHSIFELAIQALSTGTSHAVIFWPGYLANEQLRELEQAAKNGASHGIVIRRRQHD